MTSPDWSERSSLGGERSQGGQAYLDGTVRTATPAKLRLLLLERAIEVSSRLATSWRNLPADSTANPSGTNEHSLKLVDLLTELLDGVRAKDANELSRRVADLYVFLLQHLLAAERTSDADSVDEITAVLQVEAETWRLVCAREIPVPRSHPPRLVGNISSPGLNVEA